MCDSPLYVWILGIYTLKNMYKNVHSSKVSLFMKEIALLLKTFVRNYDV